MLDNLLVSLRLFALLLWVCLWSVLVWAAKKLKKNHFRDRLIRWCYQGIPPILGVGLTVTGALAKERPLLLVTNHLSYLDVWLLGGQGALRFTPKSEVADWPIVGWICRISDCVFVDRRPDRIKETTQTVKAALARGEAICLFPEATTGNGRHLLPFKSGFFSLAEEGVFVQPAAIIYRSIKRLPIDSTQWPQIAWYGDMSLLPHLFNLLKLAPISAEIVFLPPITLAQIGDRKKLAEYCWKAISDSLERK